MVTMPTRSRVESWRFDHLEQAASQWRAQADRTEAAFNQAVQSIGSAPWEGTSADAARDLVFSLTACIDTSTNHGFVLKPSGSWTF